MRVVHYVLLYESPGIRGRGLRSYLRSAGVAAIRISLIAISALGSFCRHIFGLSAPKALKHVTKTAADREWNDNSIADAEIGDLRTELALARR